MTKFQQDLKLGNDYELKSLDYIEHDSYKQIKGYHKEFDLMITHNNTNTTYEIKSDRLASKTGNFAIEYECNNKPSGITSTTADYYIYFVINRNKEDDCYKIPTEELRELAPKYRKVKGGDGYRSLMRLIPIKDMLKYRVNKL